MLIQHNYLRMCRRRSCLTQSDVAFILDLGDYANVSRWELGQRNPDIETLLVYHLLFAIPIETLFERQKFELTETVGKRIGLRIEELQALPKDHKTNRRIAFLDGIFSRITTHPQVI